MTDTPKYYTLRKPVTMDELRAWFTNEVVKEPLFQPLDIEQLRQQYRDAFRRSRVDNGRGEYYNEEMEDELISELLALQGIKENNDGSRSGITKETHGK